MSRARWAAALAALAAGLLVAGCGSGSSGAITSLHVAPARIFSLAAFEPAGRIQARRPTTMSFTVRMPDGRTLTTYKTGPGPYTGVHLIIVRDDLAYIIHDHPRFPPAGKLQPVGHVPGPRSIPGPGRHLSQHPGRTAQLPAVSQGRRRAPTTRSSCRRSKPMRSSTATTSTCGDVRACTRSRRPSLHVDVTDPQGRPVHISRPVVGARPRHLLQRGQPGLLPHPRVRSPALPTAGACSAPRGSPARPPRPASSPWACCCRSRAPGGCSFTG